MMVLEKSISTRIQPRPVTPRDMAYLEACQRHGYFVCTALFSIYLSIIVAFERPKYFGIQYLEVGYNLLYLYNISLKFC